MAVTTSDGAAWSSKRTGFSNLLNTLEALERRVADRHLAEAAAHGEYDPLADQLPWETRGNADALRTELAAWPVRRALRGFKPRMFPMARRTTLKPVGS